MGGNILLGQTRETFSGLHLPVVYGGDASQLVSAQAGSGKSRCVAIPDLLTYSGSAVVCDSKPELTERTALWRSVVLKQNVSVIAPFGGVDERYIPIGPDGKRCWGYVNPIDFISKSDFGLSLALKVASALIPVGTTKEPHWAQGSQLRFAASSLFVATDPRITDLAIPRNMDSLWTFLSDPQLERRALKMMLKSDNISIRKQAAKYLHCAEDDKEVASLRSHLEIACTATFGEPCVLDSMRETNIDFSQINRRPMTVYIVIPNRMIETHYTYIRLLLTIILSEIERGGLRRHDSNQPPTLIQIDEFARLQNFPLVTNAMAAMRGHGCKFSLYLQNLSQARDIYGEAWRHILGSAGVVQYFGGTNDAFTAEEVSKLCGISTVVNDSPSVSGQPGNAGSHSYSTGQRWVYTPDEIMRLPTPEQIIKVSGQNPMREHTFHPDLRDFPAYLAFQEAINSGFEPDDALEFSSRFMNAPAPVQMQQGQPQEERKMPKGDFFKKANDLFATLMGHGT